MGRRPRVHFNGAIYHAYARGIERRDIFMDDDDRRHFLSAMNRCVGDAGAVLHAYCLMTNHFHFAIQVSDKPLSPIMHRLMTGYGMHFNSRHGRKGHLFESRHRANPCLDDNYLAALIRYIHMNPVRAGLVMRPQDWPWSNYDPQRDSGIVLEGFDPWLSPASRQGLLLRKDAGLARPIVEIGEDVCQQSGISAEILRSPSRRKAVVDARILVAQGAIQNGHSLRKVAEWLGVAPCTISRYALRSYATTKGQAP